MPYNPNIHNRRSIRLKGYDYSKEGLYFVTICTRKKEGLFGNVMDGKMRLNEYGKIAARCWSEIPEHYPNTILHGFVVMPNHLHGIIQIIAPLDGNVIPVGANAETVGANNYLPLQPHQNNGATKLKHGTSRTIGSIVRGFKIGVTKQLNRFECFGAIWQRNYHEHIIRTNRSYQHIAHYIATNPANWEKDRFYC